MSPGAVVINPQGRRFRIYTVGLGAGNQPVFRLDRLDRQPREQRHIWRPQAEVRLSWRVESCS